MPTNGNEVFLTEIETKVLSVFVQHHVFSDLQIANELTELANKLRKGYEDNELA